MERWVNFVQWQTNISEYETIKTSPFKFIFGIESKVGLASTVFPPNMLCIRKTEKHLDTILQNEAEGEGQERRDRKEKLEAPQFAEALQRLQLAKNKTEPRMTSRAKHLFKCPRSGWQGDAESSRVWSWAE